MTDGCLMGDIWGRVPLDVSLNTYWIWEHNVIGSGIVRLFCSWNPSL